MSVPRPGVATARRTVIKLGTRVLTHDDGRIALARLFAVIEAAAELRHAGREVLIVSSGAVGLGLGPLGLTTVPDELQERQACAAIGQTRLMGLYEAGFAKLGLVCGQVLLNQTDFDDRVRYLNLRGTLSTLVRRGVVPVINENDAVSTEELAFVEGAERPVFGDNDMLSALVATKLDAELLVLLTDVDGVFDRDPRRDAGATLFEQIDDASTLPAGAVGPGGALGRGGMQSKLEAATVTADAGCHAIIASGMDAEALRGALAGDAVGTWFPPRRRLTLRSRWIAFAAAPRGTLHLDHGAVEAIRTRGASVLAAGVHACDGEFRQGEVVELRDPEGEVVGRGIVYCDAETARAWCGGQPPPGVRNHHALVHRNHLVLERAP